MSKLPNTDSIAQLAQFWQDHDLSDFDAELETVDKPVFQRPETIMVPLPVDDARALHSLAAKQGKSEADRPSVEAGI